MSIHFKRYLSKFPENEQKNCQQNLYLEKVSELLVKCADLYSFHYVLNCSIPDPGNFTISTEFDFWDDFNSEGHVEKEGLVDIDFGPVCRIINRYHSRIFQQLPRIR